MDLFDKIPENLFTVLTSKHKKIYALAMLTLYDSLLLFKSSIKKTDFLNMLKSRGERTISFFDYDDLDNESVSDDFEPTLAQKSNLILNRLIKTGWVEQELELSSGIEYLFLPSYSIKMLGLLYELAKVGTDDYLPLVHNIYSDLKLEDDLKDDYMYRSLINAFKLTSQLELSITLLHHSIVVYSHDLKNVFSPNDILHSHFDSYRQDIGDKVYHPLKTFDSLGLYYQPTTAILKNWLNSPAIIEKLCQQARHETANQALSDDDLKAQVIYHLTSIIDVYARLTQSFKKIDKANSDYTEAVAKKITYLNSKDQTAKGKLNKIMLCLAKQIKAHDGNLERVSLLNSLKDSFSFYRQSFINSDSLTMPNKRELREDSLPLPLEDNDFILDDNYYEMLFEGEGLFDDEAVMNFVHKAFGNKKKILTTDFIIESYNDLILLILAIIKAELVSSFYNITKLDDNPISYEGFMMPLYEFERKD